MSKPATSLLKRLTLTYKTSRFPWKRHALIGYDLDGNEYWDCPNPLGGRMKRWVQMIKSEDNDLTVFRENKLPVQWQAWLRHTRDNAPSIEELVLEERRKATIQHRAKKLELEWEQRKLQLEQEKEQEQIELARLAAIEQAEKEQKEIEKLAEQAQTSKSTQPSGHGDDFEPGAWNPGNVRRR